MVLWLVVIQAVLLICVAIYSVVLMGKFSGRNRLLDQFPIVYVYTNTTWNVHSATRNMKKEEHF